MNEDEPPTTPREPSAPEQPSAPKVLSVPIDSSLTSGDQQEDQHKKRDQHKKKARPWYQNPTVIIASLALVVSVVSSVATVLNNSSAAKSQDEQQLLTLTQDLTQIPSQLAALQQTYAKNPATLQYLTGSLQATNIVEAEEAAQLIAVLGNQVPGIEAYEVAVAFGSQANYAQAIDFYSLASSREVDPFTLASIYRGWAGILYNLGEPDQARTKIAAAYSVYTHATNIGLYGRTDSYIFTTLFQIPYEVYLHNCSYAQKQFVYAEHLLASLPTTESNYSTYTSDAAREKQSVENCS
jgi:tetratricopeptide (TPR) repeat protein